MRRRSRSRNIEIFNFSFLDILACTIGLLIFIMVMVFILQAGSPVADAGAVITRTQEAAARAAHSAERDNQTADALESQIEQIHSTLNPDLVRQRDQAVKSVNAARAEYDEKMRQLHQLETAIETARRTAEQVTSQQEPAQASLSAAKQRLAKALAALAAATPDDSGPNVHVHMGSALTMANRYQILHVDCRAQAVVLWEMGADGTSREVGHSSANSLSSDDSDFARSVAKYHRLTSPLVLFWVRPDGVETYDRAMSALPAGMAHGHEPADADWNFTGTVGH